MPNTLAHIGINGIFSKTVIKKADLIWIYLGCIIPDIPWIIRKSTEILLPSINGYDLQAYVIVEATLFFSILLSAAFASISKNFWKTLLILSFGSLLHLLLDSIQIKWANGVHLFAPVDWSLINFGFFWPESAWTYLLTLLGLLFFLYNWQGLKESTPQFNLSVKNLFISASFLVIYFVGPLYFMNEVKIADNHFISSLEEIENRVGKYIEMDRRKIFFDKNEQKYFIQSFDKSKIKIENIKKLSSSKLSIRGEFVNKNTIWITEYHENWDTFRDGASYLGLALILLYLFYHIVWKELI